MSYNNFGVSPETRLDPSGLPVPENNIPVSVSTTYPLSVRREAYLASVSCHRVAGESLLAVLPEIVRTVDKNLIVERLRGEVFVYGTRRQQFESVKGTKIIEQKIAYWKGVMSLRAWNACVALRYT